MQQLFLKIKKYGRFSLLMTIAACCLYSCKQSDPPLAPVELQFETNELGFAADQSTIDVHLTLSRAAEQDGKLQLHIQENGVVYGSAYQTHPAASNGMLQVPFQAGDQELTFTIKKTPDQLL